jgi:hypothetical protein
LENMRGSDMALLLKGKSTGCLSNVRAHMSANDN